MTVYSLIEVFSMGGGLNNNTAECFLRNFRSKDMLKKAFIDRVMESGTAFVNGRESAGAVFEQMLWCGTGFAIFEGSDEVVLFVRAEETEGV